MKVILRLEADSGIELTSLVLPLDERAYLMLSAKELSRLYIVPYLDSLKLDSFIWQRICRSGGQGVATQNPYGPI